MMNNLKDSVQESIKIQLKLIKKIIIYKQKRKIMIIYNQLINKKVKIKQFLMQITKMNDHKIYL